MNKKLTLTLIVTALALNANVMAMEGQPNDNNPNNNSAFHTGAGYWASWVIGTSATQFLGRKILGKKYDQNGQAILENAAPAEEAPEAPVETPVEASKPPITKGFLFEITKDSKNGKLHGYVFGSLEKLVDDQGEAARKGASFPKHIQAHIKETNGLFTGVYPHARKKKSVLQSPQKWQLEKLDHEGKSHASNGFKYWLIAQIKNGFAPDFKASVVQLNLPHANNAQSYLPAGWHTSGSLKSVQEMSYAEFLEATVVDHASNTYKKVKELTHDEFVEYAARAYCLEQFKNVREGFLEYSEDYGQTTRQWSVSYVPEPEFVRQLGFFEFIDTVKATNDMGRYLNPEQLKERFEGIKATNLSDAELEQLYEDHSDAAVEKIASAMHANLALNAIERHNKMTSRMDELLQLGTDKDLKLKPLFVVYSAHLGGKNGVVQMMKDKGYSVKLVKPLE